MSRRKEVSTTQPLLLSVADVAAQLGVCRQTVYNFIYHEGLPSVLVRRIRRVHSDSLEQWIRAREHQILYRR
jgi:excisionase family DNA binding protein